MHLFRRIGFWLIFVPIALLFIAFALANRQSITLAIDPFTAGSEGMALPLFLALFLFLALGAMIGAFLAWNGQRPWRRKARLQEREIEQLQDELAQLKTGKTRLPAGEAWQIQPPL